MVKIRVIGSRLYLIVIIAATLIMSIVAAAIAAGEPAGKNPAVSSPYQDVTANDPNTVFIKYISQKGIISGFPDGTYHPAEGLSRAQAAVIICRAAALKTPAVNGSSFKDVPLAHWALTYVDAAAKAGYIKGFPDGSYQPDSKLTRSQAISLIMRLCTQKERAALPALQDMNSGHWAAADMATALALDMVQTSQDGQQIYPDKDMSRAELARALALLLTKDSGLSQVKLSGQLTEIKGEVTLTRNNKTEKLTKDTSIYEADIIQTGKDGSARIIYPDGSGNLLEENVEIAFKKANGKSYIKQDGTPGVAVDFLNIELRKGTLFGALSTKTENLSENKQSSLSSRLASRDPLRQLAAAETAQPWYKTAEKKKVRMQVDMPWGVAAVRGTFIKVSVNTDGTCDVCCLSGTTDTTTNAGNIIINGGDKAVIKAENSAPEKGTMTADDKAGFAKEQEWVVNTALKMDANRAAEIVVKTDDKQTVEQKTETTVKTVIDALKSSGIQLKAEVIEKLKQDIQAEFKKEAAESLIKDVDTSSKNATTITTTTTTTNNSNSNNVSDSSSSNISYNQAGTYGGNSAAAPQTINGTVVVNASGVILHNLIISGNLVLAASIGEGDATLRNVKVTGTTTVSGGGANSVKVEDCNLNQVTVKKEGSIVHIIASGTTVVGPLTLESGANLEESGLSGSGFSSILTAQSFPAGTTIILSGNFASVAISAPGLNIQVASGSIGAINLAATAIGTSLNLATGVTVSTLEINAEDVQVGGTGHIASATINAAGISITTPPASWTVKVGLNSTIGGQQVTGSGSHDYAINITAIPDRTVQVDQTVTIPITTDPADATLSAALVAGSSVGSADISLSGKTLSVTGRVFGAVTIKVDAVKAGYTAASSTFTVDVQNKPPYGQITAPADGAALAELTSITGTTNGQGSVVTGGGVFIHNDTLNKWVKPLYRRADGAFNGKEYVDTPGEDCLIGSLSDVPDVSAAVYSTWSIDNLAGLKLPNGQEYTIYLRVIVEGLGAQEAQDTVSFELDAISGISAGNSLWTIYDEQSHGIARFNFYICDGNEELIAGLNPDQFTLAVDGAETPVSCAQLPFGGFAFDDDDGGYNVTYIGSGQHTFADLKIGGVPLSDDPAEYEVVNISGGATLTGTVKDQNNQTLEGVKVSVAGLGYPGESFNYTFTNGNGDYTLAIPGGGDLLIKFAKGGYSCGDQSMENSTSYSLDAVMTEDNQAPDGITINLKNRLSEALLTVTNGPLSDESWQAIFNLLYDNTGTDESSWIIGNQRNLDYQISPDGTQMGLIYWIEGSVPINHDFIIPKELVVDRAGNQAQDDIRIDSCQPWMELGDIDGVSDGAASDLSLTMFNNAIYVGFSDATVDGKATVKKLASGSWAALGSPGFSQAAVSATALGSVQMEGNIVLFSYIYGSQVGATGCYQCDPLSDSNWSNPFVTGSSARLLQCAYPAGNLVVAFEDTVMGDIYGTARYGFWDPIVLDESEDEVFFYTGNQPLSALSMDYDSTNEIMYVAYIDINGQISVKKSDAVNHTWADLGFTYSGTASAISLKQDGGHLYLAVTDNQVLKVAVYDNGLELWTDMSPVGNFTGSQMMRLFVDNNVPYLAFTDSQNQISLLQYKKPDWEWMGDPYFAQTSGELQLFVDDKIPYVAYLDTDNRVHVMKYGLVVP